MKYFRYVLIGFLGLLSVVTAEAQSRRNSSLTASEGTEVTFRCALWANGKDKDPLLYVKEGRDYTPMPLYVMAFQQEFSYRGTLPIPIFRKATLEEAAQRKEEGYKKADQEYIPLFSINPKGMTDIGVILLPGTFEKKSANEILVFDWSNRNFPYGTIRIANFTRRNLLGKLTPQGEEDAKGETFKLKHGGAFTSTAIDQPRKIFQLQLAAVVDKTPKVVYSSAAAFQRDTRTMIFIIPDSKIAQSADSVPRFEFRAIKDRKRPKPKPKNKGKPDAEKSAEK